jgi:flagellar protein FliO/FliZ
MKAVFFFLILVAQLLMASKAMAETVTNGVNEAENVALFPAEKAAAIETKTTKAPAETEIPLNLETNKKATTSEGMAGKIIYSIAILLILGGGLIYMVRRYSLPKNSKTQTQIKVLSQHHFGPKRSLALVRVAGESILIGITDQNINLVKSLSMLDEEIPEEVPQNFEKTLKQKNQEEPGLMQASAEMSPEEDFAITGIKDIVHRRLKTMRNFQ